MVTYAGWQLNIRVATTTGALSSATNLSGIQRISYNRTENIDVKTECGTRFPFLVEGIFGLTGTIERYHTGSGIWTYFGGSTKTGALSYYVIGIYPAGYGSGNPFIYIDGVKFNDLGGAQRPGPELFTDTIDWIATGSIQTGSVP